MGLNMTDSSRTKQDPVHRLPAEESAARARPTAKQLADAAARPSVNAALVITAFGKVIGVDNSAIGEMADAISESIDEIWAGDMKRAEAMLLGQAHALQTMFSMLARRAGCEPSLKQQEGYLRMALKAQNQCRMTLETLATLKNPSVVIARQANINHGGQQQVNNGLVPDDNPGSAFTHAGKPQTAPTELLEPSDGKRVDTRAPRKTGSADSDLETVGAVLRPKKR